MPSTFEAKFASFAAASLAEQFGDRDDAGALTTASYHSPAVSPDAAAYSLASPIWSSVRFEDVIDPVDGGLVRRETRTCHVLRSAVDAAGIEGFEMGAWIEDPDGDEDSAWELSEAATVWGEAFVTFGLVRMPLVRRGEQRRAAV